MPQFTRAPANVGPALITVVSKRPSMPTPVASISEPHGAHGASTETQMDTRAPGNAGKPNSQLALVCAQHQSLSR